MASTRTVLITGAASGIGAVLGRRLAKPGAQIALHTGSNEAGLAAVAAEVEAAGATVLTSVGDLRDPAACNALVASVTERFGALDGFVSNAGYADRTQFEEVDTATLHATFDAMTVAFMNIVHAATPFLKASSCARVVAVSSFVAHRYQLGDRFPASAVAKAGLETLVRMAAERLASAGVCVNAVAPGYIQKDHETDFTDSERHARRPGISSVPMQRIGQPGEIAAVIEFLLSEQVSYMTGQVLHVDGGMML